MTRIAVTDGWTMGLLAGPFPDDLPAEIPASVPGCVHTDLVAQQLIPDPYLDRNEQQLQWIGETDVRYRTTFNVVDEGHERIDLVALGLDTVATLSLNGTEIGHTRNQHRSYRFDLGPTVRATDNELRIDFDAPLRAARESEQRIGARPLVGDALPYNALRKMACNFGWDWGPTLTTSGIWKPIYVHQWSTARLAGVVPQVSIDANGDGQVELRIELERTAVAELTLLVDLLGPDGTSVQRQMTSTATAVVMGVTVASPELWWPRGYGAQSLYQLTVRVDHDGAELDRWSHDIGFRTAELRMNPDEYGTGFEFHINGTFVFVKGANWIPDDCIPIVVTRARYERAVQHAVDADMNMLRVWGGGIYENDDFYDICNRQGGLPDPHRQVDAAQCHVEDCRRVGAAAEEVHAGQLRQARQIPDAPVDDGPSMGPAGDGRSQVVTDDCPVLDLAEDVRDHHVVLGEIVDDPRILPIAGRVFFAGSRVDDDPIQIRAVRQEHGGDCSTNEDCAGMGLKPSAGELPRVPLRTQDVPGLFGGRPVQAVEHLARHPRPPAGEARPGPEWCQFDERGRFGVDLHLWLHCREVVNVVLSVADIFRRWKDPGSADSTLSAKNLGDSGRG